VTDPHTNGVRALRDLDRLVHEPARLAILTVLAEAEEVEFRFVETVTGLTRGNLSSHASKLDEAGYIVVEKAFRGAKPVTSYRITDLGRGALTTYRERLRAAIEAGPNDS
jgi:DNA-binding transcriptional ArsR family regulator